MVFPRSSTASSFLSNQKLFILLALVLLTGLTIVSNRRYTLDYLKYVTSELSGPSHEVVVMMNHTKQQALYDYSCYPSREQWNYDNTTEKKAAVIKTYNNPIVYIELSWNNLHCETFYSFIHEVCSCETNKDSAWTITNDTQSTIPHFYLGPPDYVKEDLRRILAEFNTTSCGPIYFGKPSVTPQLTIVTTRRGHHFTCDDNATSCKHLRDPRKIYICHDEAPSFEGDNASSIYWLTPLHSRYILPTFFPPTIVQQSLSKDVNKPIPRNPVFLVTGGFWDGRKRSTKSLIPVLKGTRQYNYTIKFLGGDPYSSDSNRNFKDYLNTTFAMYDNPDYEHKIELVTKTDAYEFMQHVADADVILPLVDNTNLYASWGYRKGKKLTSSITWALGFRKKMVLFQELAHIYGLLEKNDTDNSSYWLYNEEEDSFLNAFRNCLEYFGSTKVQ